MAVMLETASEPFNKRARSTEYVVSLVHPDGVDTVDEESAEVYCVSQNMRKLTDPCVAERFCLIADSEAEGSLRVKGTSVENYIMTEYNNMYIVCFEAFKLLDQGFTDILKSTGGLKEHETFVKEFRQAARTVARTQNISIPEGKLWVDYLSFGGFAQAIKNLYDCEVINEADKKQVASLKQYAEDVFRDILHDGLEFLEEEVKKLNVLPQRFVDLEAIKMLPLTEIVTQWVSCYNFRAKRNSHEHPFSASSPIELRKASLKFYEKCLNHGITEGFRTVALLGKLKLDIQEKKLVQHSKLKTSSITVSDVLNQDESDSDIEEYLD